MIVPIAYYARSHDQGKKIQSSWCAYGRRAAAATRRGLA